jgi:hypothetical protein
MTPVNTKIAANRANIKDKLVWHEESDRKRSATKLITK